MQDGLLILDLRFLQNVSKICEGHAFRTVKSQAKTQTCTEIETEEFQLSTVCFTSPSVLDAADLVIFELNEEGKIN